jgi:ubiquinone/menaquinone biosynthesis C-methylase UbiE
VVLLKSNKLKVIKMSLIDKYGTTHEQYRGEYDNVMELISPHSTLLHSNLSLILENYIKTIFPNEEQIQVLEFGTGTGETTKWLLQTDPRINLHSVDSSKEMLIEAEKVLKPFSDRVTFYHADFNNQTFLDSLVKEHGSKFNVFAEAWSMHNPSKVDNNYQHIFQAIYYLLSRDGFFISADKYDPSKTIEEEANYCKNFFQQLKLVDRLEDEVLVSICQHLVEDQLDKVKLYGGGGRIKQLEEIGFKFLNYKQDYLMEGLLCLKK